MKFIMAITVLLVCAALAEAAPRGWVCGPNGCRPARRTYVPTPTPSVAQAAKPAEKRETVGVATPRVYGARRTFTVVRETVREVVVERPLRKLLSLPFRAFRACRR